MDERDFKPFGAMLDDAVELMPNWKAYTPKAKVLFFKTLQGYSFDVVRQAMTAHLRDPERGRYQPAPADLIAKIEGANGNGGRPGAEEAWAIALPAFDEMETVIWTEEMRDAFAICRPILERGDRGADVAARMSFKEAYLRLCVDAARMRRPVKWEVTLGRDAAKREVVIQQAVEIGRLPAPQASLLLPAPVRETDVDREGLARLKAEIAKLVPASEKMARMRDAQLQAKREAEAARKREIAEKVAQYTTTQAEAAQ